MTHDTDNFRCCVVEASCLDCETALVIGHVTPRGIQAFVVGHCPDCGENLEVREVKDISSAARLHEVKSLLLAGKKVAAIKEYRTQTGAGLKEAKDFVESLPEHQEYRRRNNAGLVS